MGFSVWAFVVGIKIFAFFIESTMKGKPDWARWKFASIISELCKYPTKTKRKKHIVMGPPSPKCVTENMSWLQFYVFVWLSIQQRVNCFLLSTGMETKSRRKFHWDFAESIEKKRVHFLYSYCHHSFSLNQKWKKIKCLRIRKDSPRLRKRIIIVGIDTHTYTNDYWDTIGHWLQLITGIYPIHGFFLLWQLVDFLKALEIAHGNCRTR